VSRTHRIDPGLTNVTLNPAVSAPPTYRLRLALLKPGAVADKRRGVLDVVMGATMYRAILQYWQPYEGANDASVPDGRWIDVEIGEDGEEMKAPEVGI